MNYSKASMGRLSEFAKSTKNMLLYGNQNSMPRINFNNPVKGDPKNIGKNPIMDEVSVITTVNKGSTRQTDAFTQADLQQAIIWSEILGKPVSKRRERRYYGN